MGWSAGTEIAHRLIESISDNVVDDVTKEKLIQEMFEILMDADWDNLDEVEGIDPIADIVIKKITGEYDNGESECN